MDLSLDVASIWDSLAKELVFVAGARQGPVP
jgi:hypothetical protein